MTGRGSLSLLLITLAAAIGLGACFVLDRHPRLGLDLQGGASVVLAPTTRENVSQGTLEQAIEIIRQRVDALGVAEPEITNEGNNILIQLPGVRDPDRILSLVGQTATLEFRPVLAAGEPGQPLTPREEDEPGKVVVLPELDRNGNEVARYRLGPSLADGRIVASASAAAPQLAGEWSVEFTLTGSGSRTFDSIAARCNPPSEACPTGRLAIVLDSVVKSAPVIQESRFGGRGTITGDFREREAKDLALVLRYGSLPVELETIQRTTVSPTLGRQSLNAGVVAGLLGLALVMVYMIAYYRALGLVVLVGLAISFALLWSILTLLSVHRGLTLSLAGAIGVIISIGVTVDSYVVYFERLHEEVRSGRTLRASVGRSFDRAWRTTLVANGTSFIGAAILYFLSVGQVRGFAFTLALSTVLDVVVTYFFTRPVVAVLGRTRFFTSSRVFGIVRGLTPAGAR